MTRYPNLLIIDQFYQTIELIRDEEITSRPAQDLVERTVELQETQNGYKIGRGLMKRQVVLARNGALWETEDSEQHQVRSLVSDNIEIQGERERRFASIILTE